MFERQQIEAGRLPGVVLAKWNAEVLSEGFTPVPKRLLRCLPQLFRGRHVLEHLAVILAVVDYRRPQLSRPPSVEYLSFIAGMTPEKFKKRISELEMKGCITVDGCDAAFDVGIEPFLKEIIHATQDE